MKKLFFLIAVCVICSVSGATYIVTTNADSGPGSLREAITFSNADPGPIRIINFAIGTGIQTITLLNASGPLPAITQTVTIDATTQPGYNGTPLIVLNGSLLTAAFNVSGFLIQDTSNCVIKGFVIQGFPAFDVSTAGVFITSTGIAQANNNQISNCYIGTDVTGTVAVPNRSGIAIRGTQTTNCDGNIITGNLISGNTSHNGITLYMNVNDTVIQSNIIGTDITGLVSLPNSSGIVTFGTLSDTSLENCNNTIIGGVSGQGNLISGNRVDGIALESNTNFSVIYGNFIGTDVTGNVALPNGAVGIIIFGAFGGTSNERCVGNIIGGPNPGQGNVISGNGQQGILIQSNVSGTVIQGNIIGTDASSQLFNLGNGSSGITFVGTTGYPSDNNLIGGTAAGDNNLIVYNGLSDPNDYFGVFLNSDPTTPDVQNSILGNSIFNNIGNGIELENNGNDNQEPPIINYAAGIGTQLMVSATAPTTPAGTHFRLEFFINEINRNPITEGQTFVGSIDNVPSGETVEQTFTLTLFSLGFLSATATNLNGPAGAPGDTSQFSDNVVIMIPQLIISPISAAIINKYCVLSINSGNHVSGVMHINPIISAP